MRRKPSIYSVLRATTKEQLIESLNWLLYSVGGSTLPIWLGGYVLLPIVSKHFHWLEYGQHGEFALYSAALITPTLRLIARDVEEFEFVRRQLFLFLGWIFLTVSVAIYSCVIAVSGSAANELNLSSASASGTVGLSLNVAVLFRFSLALFVLTVLFSFVVTLIDSQRVGTSEIFAAQQAGVRQLEQAFAVTAPETSRPTPDQSTSQIRRDVGGESAGSDEEPAVPVDLSGEQRDRLEKDFDGGQGDVNARDPD